MFQNETLIQLMEIKNELNASKQANVQRPYYIDYPNGKQQFKKKQNFYI